MKLVNTLFGQNAKSFMLNLLVKFNLEQAAKAQRGSRGTALLFFNLGARWGGWSTSRPGRFTLGKENLYPLYRRLGGPQERSGRVRKISPPTGFDPRTVQPVVSRYTDCAYQAPYLQARNRNGTKGFGGHRLALTMLFLLISVHLHVRSCVSCADYARLAVVKYEYGTMME